MIFTATEINALSERAIKNFNEKIIEFAFLNAPL